MIRAQSLLVVAILLCYVLIAPIVARPLAIDVKKRQSNSEEMEDMESSATNLQRSGEEVLQNQQDITFYSSNGITLWSNGVIPYTFAKDFAEVHKKKAKKAMETWSESTCITFRRLKNSELRRTNILDYVLIKYGNITSSYVGIKERDYLNRGQELTMNRNEAGNGRLYLHEFGHVIGFNHEHSRQDRDRYVTINTGNIRSGVERNFEKLDYVKNTPYDYYSIMHYGVGDYATSKNVKTIQILNPDNIGLDIDVIGRRRKLSEHDIAYANKLYSCVVTSKPPPPPKSKFYAQFKVELPRAPKVVPDSGYALTPKQYLNCSNVSCDVKGTEKVTLFITKLNNSIEELRVGDQVLLSLHKSSARHGEWILCDQDNCRTSKTCLVHPYNVSHGLVNFAFNRCEEYVLKISSKSKQLNETIGNNDRIVLEHITGHHTDREFVGCDPNGYCKRTECKRPNITILQHAEPCKEQLFEFEAIFVS